MTTMTCKMSRVAAGVVVLLWAVAFVSVDAQPTARDFLDRYFGSVEAPPPEFRHRRDGFRAGASDRFSHGFGKRSSVTSDNLFSPSDEDLMTSSSSSSRPGDEDSDNVELMSDEMLADELTRSQLLSIKFVRVFVDVDDDGFISAGELEPLIRR